MDGRRLNLREQRILAEIETVLRKDRRLDERLRTLRPTRGLRLLRLQRRLRAMELSLLIPAAILLSLAAARTAGRGLIIAASCVGAVTLLLLSAAVRCRMARRREERVVESAAHRLTPPDQ
ncbi:MAG: DUF3040 domain-containing protein [Actinocrinis sp.]